MTTWKQFGFYACLGLLASGIVSCRPTLNSSTEKTATAGGQQSLEFWTMQLQPEFTEYFNERIARFEAENPDLTVRWVDVPWTAMESKILTAVAAGTAPDVVNLNPSFAIQLAERNAWLPLNDWVTEEIRQLYLPNIWKANTLNGQSFGIPWYLTTQVTIYNTALFQQAGLAQPPATYTELAQVARQIKDKTGKYACFFTFVPDDSAEVLESLVQMGVQLVDDQGQAAFDSPEGRVAFQYWVDLYQDKLLPRSVLTQGHRHAIELYQAGEIALLSTGSEFLKTIAKNAPAIAQTSATAPQITGTTGKRNVAVMNLVLPRDTDQPEAALEFALFVTNSDNQLAFAQAANVLPSTVQSLQQYQQELTGTTAESSPLVQGQVVSAQQIAEAEVLVPPMPNIKELQKIIYDNLQAAMLGEKTVDEAIAAAAETWNALP